MQEEEKEKGEKVPTKLTRDWKSFLGDNFSKDDFDKIPIKEIREKILNSLRPDWDFDWLYNRANAYLAVNDFSTTFMILRKLGSCTLDDEKQKIINLMAETVKKALSTNQYLDYYLEDAIVILCGKINYSNSSEEYHGNKNIREVFEMIIKKYYPKVYGCAEKEARLILRVLFSIICMKETYFLPILKKIKRTKSDIDHIVKYVSADSKEEIYLEGLRLLIIQHLES